MPFLSLKFVLKTLRNFVNKMIFDLETLQWRFQYPTTNIYINRRRETYFPTPTPTTPHPKKKEDESMVHKWCNWNENLTSIITDKETNFFSLSLLWKKYKIGLFSLWVLFVNVYFCEIDLTRPKSLKNKVYWFFF